MKVVRTVILSLILVFLAFVIYRAAKGGRKIPASTIRAEYRDIESKLTTVSYTHLTLPTIA